MTNSRTVHTILDVERVILTWGDYRMAERPGQMYAALAYYHEHQVEFEGEILRQAERTKAWAEAAKDSPIRQRLKEQSLLP